MPGFCKTIRVKVNDRDFKTLIKFFSDKDTISDEGLTEKETSSLMALANEGAVMNYVSDWGNQETEWHITNVGKQLLHK